MLLLVEFTHTRIISSLTATVGSCHITRDADNAVGTPTFVGTSQTTYSCVANDNPNYDVHVISNYGGNGYNDFQVSNTSVHLSVSGTSSKSLILVFISYEPVNWILDIPSGVTIDKAILVSTLHNSAFSWIHVILSNVSTSLLHRCQPTFVYVLNQRTLVTFITKTFLVGLLIV